MASKYAEAIEEVRKLVPGKAYVTTPPPGVSQNQHWDRLRTALYYARVIQDSEYRLRILRTKDGRVAVCCSSGY